MAVCIIIIYHYIQFYIDFINGDLSTDPLRKSCLL